ncbi:MAG: hypothetical protein JSW65_01180 [Candidatus Bipolaricaulota bacterium]|nr:MAG: hypothetical protein JSW65_01180 [Candidatus Bipolaricaulota bacterium]
MKEAHTVRIRRLGLLLVIVALIPVAARGNASSVLDAQGTGAGSVAVHFYGSLLTITFEAELHVVGTLLIEGEPISFEASGTAHGDGEGDSGTLEATIWSTLVAEGAFEDGEPLSVRGGLSVESKDVEITAAAAGEGTGHFYLIVTTPSAEMHLVGTVSGDASGGFVPAPPDDPYAMVYAGEYTFHFEEATVVPAEGNESDADPWPHLPWSVEDWPEEMATELLLLLEGEAQDGEEPVPEGVDEGFDSL